MALVIKKQKEAFNFYESFSDMLFNTLVLFLVLIVGLSILASNEAAKYQEKSKGLDEKLAEIEQRVKKMRGEETALKFERDKVSEERDRIAKENVRLTQMKEDLSATIAQQTATLRLQAQAADERAEKLKQALAAFVGMKGQLKNVVFVVDLSGSMIGYYDSSNRFIVVDELKERFERVRDEVANMVAHLDIEEFNVIGFSGDNENKPRLNKVFQSLVPSSTENRTEAARKIKNWQAGGGTPTLSALDAAFSMGEVDTIILYSDGEPSIPNNQMVAPKTAQQVVLELCRTKNIQKKVVINTVAVGAYDRKADDADNTAQLSFVQFMRTIANENGGGYSAR